MGDRPAFLTAAEVAAHFGVSRRHVYELIRRGELPVVKLGRRRVIPARAIELIEERVLAEFDPSAALSALEAS